MLGWAAANARLLLVLGLVAGAGLPALSAALVQAVPPLIAALLFFNAFRSGPRLLGGFRGALGEPVALVLALQVILPLAALLALSALGLLQHPFALAAVLTMAAPPLTGTPNFVAMAGHDPAGAMRLLVLGTAAFPLTMLAVLWALPGVSQAEAQAAALRLAAVILSVALAGAGARIVLARRLPAPRLDRAADGASALLLSVAVVGLMAEFGPLLRAAPGAAAAWVAGVLALNLALQLGALLVARALGVREAVAASVFAGNRNIALFLLALPPSVVAPVMLFVACYQVPMYLTPLIMRRLHAAGR